ncbi:hypothetical protein PoB_006040500 [Plakobranchus ocellatus]|uniref:Uncharacterized protein n=1 Tax=Plakobranchus ocellatus TaxID=259542 RepID=A0AAV4CPS6_9GAST|nr:hypothetical protein PoB_006040500 [Plakobranchus ocellatus]
MQERSTKFGCDLKCGKFNVFRLLTTHMNGEDQDKKRRGKKVSQNPLKTGRVGGHKAKKPVHNKVISNPPSGLDAGGRARTRDRRVPIDLWADLLATVPPTSPRSGSAYTYFRTV